MSKQSVKFDLNDTIFEIPSNTLEIDEDIQEDINENIKEDIQIYDEDEYDTDYEDEDPKETLRKLLKGRSFGTEEFGRDYKSNAELNRQ